MKRFFSALMGIALILGTSSCNKNFVEKTIDEDKQTMYTEFGDDYRWFETDVVLENWLDEKNDNTVETVLNIFQVVEIIDSTSADVFVHKFEHKDNEINRTIAHDFFVGNHQLNNVKITVSFKKAYDRVQKSKYEKPHSRQVVLRWEIGAEDCNPQWIFGNTQSQLYVDALTGEVSDTNPAYLPENK